MLNTNKYDRVKRTVNGSVAVYNDDVVLLCDTSLGVCTVNLAEIPANKWSTEYKLYVKDSTGNAGTNNITITAPTGYKINNQTSVVLSSNGACARISIVSNTDYIGEVTVAATTGITNFTVTDTGTIDLTLTPISGGFNLKADAKLQDWFTAVKNMTDQNTSYCKRTDQYGLLKYDTLVGAFTIGETITGGTSGATATITSNAFGTMLYNTLVGAFVVGETITGGTSAATAVLTSTGKYENPFQSITNGSIFSTYDVKTENGGLVGAFNLATGTFTVPLGFDGWYYFQSQIGWALNGSDQYSFKSDNPNTLNQFWMLGSTSQGTFSITNYLVGSGLMSVGLKSLTQGSNALFQFANNIIRLNVGQQVRVVYTNNSDLEMFGQPNSNVILRVLRLGN